MPDKTDAIFVLPVFDAWLLYAPLHKTGALGNAAAVAAVKDASSSSQEESVQQLLDLLSDGEEPPQPNVGPPQPRFLGLIPTRKCGLSCVYCDFDVSRATDGTMSFPVVKSAIDWMANYVAAGEDKLLEIHFFGGEPFFAPQVVDMAVHYARSVAALTALHCHFEVTTNGFFDKQRCRFVSDYFDSVVLSLDGPKDVQNRHRPSVDGVGTFDTVFRNAQLLSESSAELCIRACVTQDTVADLETFTRWFCDELKPAKICFEPVQPVARSNEAGLVPPDPWDFATAFLRAEPIAAERGTSLVYAAASIDRLCYSSCPVGADTLIVSPDGRVSACYLLRQSWLDKGMCLDLGQVNPSGGIDLDQPAVERTRTLTHSKTQCTRCLARWHCGGGCHVRQSHMQGRESYNDFCVRTRIISTCRILAQLGLREHVQRLLSDRLALEKLIHQRSDRLQDWRTQS